MRRAAAAALFTVWAVPVLAWAQDAVSLDLKERALFGKGHPVLTVRVHEPLESLSVRLRSPGQPSVQRSLESPGTGDALEIALEVKRPGSHRYRGELKAAFPNGSTATLPLDFTVVSLTELRFGVEASPESVAEGTVKVQPGDGRRLVRFEIALFDQRGKPMTETEGAVEADGTVRWDPTERTVGKIELRVHAEDGTFRDVSLFPWRIDVPHQEVHFHTASAEIDPSEAPKLQDSLEKIRMELEAVRPWADAKLFVAGHTDTVGSASSNRALSARRARSIAAWFRQAGLTVPVFYAGFGEDVLAKSTPDQTDEPANRRAEYIIAVDPPPLPSGSPRWQPLEAPGVR